MFQVKVREENFIELHYVIKDDCSIPTFLPYQPLLLRKDVMNLNTHLVNIESWNGITNYSACLGQIFWNKTYLMMLNIKYENKLNIYSYKSIAIACLPIIKLININPTSPRFVLFIAILKLYNI